MSMIVHLVGVFVEYIEASKDPLASKANFARAIVWSSLLACAACIIITVLIFVRDYTSGDWHGMWRAALPAGVSILYFYRSIRMARVFIAIISRPRIKRVVDDICEEKQLRDFDRVSFVDELIAKKAGTRDAVVAPVEMLEWPPRLRERFLAAAWLSTHWVWAASASAVGLDYIKIVPAIAVSVILIVSMHMAYKKVAERQSLRGFERWSIMHMDQIEARGMTEEIMRREGLADRAELHNWVMSELVRLAGLGVYAESVTFMDREEPA